MTITTPNSILSLGLGQRFGNPLGGSSRSSSPAKVKVHPMVLFAILDHYLRRPEEQNGVIGTLLGVRSEDGSILEIRNCFPVPHNETEEQVAVDMDYHRKMYELHQKVSKTEVIVGWYATGPSLNPYSALIQNFYHAEVDHQAAVHLVMDTSLQGEQFGVKVFNSSPIGLLAKNESCVFRQVPSEIQVHRSERSGLDVLCSASRQTDKENPTQTLLTDSARLVKAIEQIQSMLSRVTNYIEEVLQGDVQPNAMIGRYLMDTLAMVPKIDPETFDKTFNAHVQDLLMVIYLANITRSQLALADSIHTMI